ncbi:NAD(P)-dependent oxidoreductase [Microbacterium terricola]|uniref:NAD-dependent epimerase n=1 Tax=Microbacterium terricola TaxID=344163 RepID=A0ABM8E062_9MICO|nr:NAD(P)H-binding protein [Microbacterium terricola]UYK40931.1 NAD(P)H-binding protein [Microbacterium terricola]BDV31318.1 NAD-dependent epimerase [Microbacterium terricola]
MTRIAVIGGTGYAGRHIVVEAVRRGHDVVAVSRKIPAERIEGATHIEGTILDVPGLLHELQGVDAIVTAIAPRGDMADAAVPGVLELAENLAGTGIRLGVIGGAGSSLSAPEGPRLMELDFPEEYLFEAQTGLDSLEGLRATPASVDWFLVHPAETFGAWNPGERTGAYRDGGQVVVRDADGVSNISGPDLGVAVVDEIESPQHRRENFTVGY